MGLLAGVAVVAATVVVGRAVATAPGVLWLCANTSPAPKTKSGVAKAMIRRTLLLAGLDSKASDCDIWNHSGLEFSALIFFLILSLDGQKVTLSTGRTLGTRLNVAE